MSKLLLLILLLVFLLIANPALAESTLPLRYLAMNVGNASPYFGCWEYKLCRAEDVKNIRNYIAIWKPDIILLSEVYRTEQLTGAVKNESILPKNYTGICGESRDRYTNQIAKWNAKNASHEHECIAWKISRLSLIKDSPKSSYGRSLNQCNYDFTGFRVKLRLDKQKIITAITVHPNSFHAKCRFEEISRYWSTLAEGNVIIGGDWNTEDENEIQRPNDFLVNYSKGKHWRLIQHNREYSAEYFFGFIKKKFDHAYSNFGLPCTSCGQFYGTDDLIFGSALGGYDNHPRADRGNGLDHRQILVDLIIP